MGELAADGSTRPPRPEESVKIEPGQLVPRNGRYVLKIAEPMDEVLYLDHLRLDVIDHPRGHGRVPGRAVRARSAAESGTSGLSRSASSPSGLPIIGAAT